MRALNIETTIDNAIRDFSVSGDAMRWTGESPEVAYLRQRLAAAEQVATLYGWIASPTESKTEKAVEQAYLDWANAYKPSGPSPEWRARIDELAARRDATIDAIRRGASEPEGSA